MKKEQKTVNLSFDNSRDIRNIEQFFLPVVIMKSNFFLNIRITEVNDTKITQNNENIQRSNFIHLNP